jgi:ferritin-like metal-binding protein YciE
MEPKTLVLQYLDEAHATETALVTNLRAHITMTTDGPYRRLLERHLEETRKHATAVNRRRKQLGGKDGRGVVAGAVGLVQDAVGQALVLTKGPLDMVRTMSQPERMLKNAKDECATEALEIATYDALEAVAKAAGDDVTARLAADHRADEERMLRDLRKLLPKLALQTVEDKTDGAAVRSTTTSRTSGGRATSGTRKRTTSSASSTRKASTAKRSTTKRSTTAKKPATKRSTTAKKS